MSDDLGRFRCKCGQLSHSAGVSSRTEISRVIYSDVRGKFFLKRHPRYGFFEIACTECGAVARQGTRR
jgi:hypothetical protein